MEPWSENRSAGSWPRRVVALAVLAGGVWLGLRLLAPRADDRDPLNRAIDEIVEGQIEAGNIAGASVGVARGLRILHARGYGYADVENRIPATESTVYRVGSITKQFTAATVMRLVERGEIRLDAPLSEYLPGWPLLDGVTVEHLLTHTSGVTNYTTDREWWTTLGLEITPARLAAHFDGEPLDFPPGERFSYSNSGYVLLGLIIEAVTGRPYGGVLNELVLVPSELSATAYCDDRMLIPNRARGYQVVDDELLHAPYVSISQAYSAGGVCSNVVDLLRWTRALSRGAAVSDDSYERMTTPATLSDGSPIEYGYGLAVSYLEGNHRVTHIGGMLGFTGQLSYYDEAGVTVVVLTNTEAANAAAIESEIARAVLGLEERATSDLALAAEELEVYTGRYDLGVTEVDVLSDGERLYADVTAPGVEGRYVFMAQGDHVFVAVDDPEIEVTFRMGPEVAEGFELVRRGITTRADRIE